MERGRAIRGLALALVALLLVPASSSATDSDFKHAYAFKVRASHGYSILALASNERADGRGEIVLFVQRGKEGVTYQAPALLTATSVEADLGALGRVALQVAPSGREAKTRSGCGRGREIAYEPPRYSGSFEFHGEEGYTDAVSASPRDYTRFFESLVCGPVSVTGQLGGDNLSGALLRSRGRQGGARFHLKANANHPSARTRFEVEVHEKHGPLRITRTIVQWLRPGAFRFDPHLSAAALDPPAPFSGEASFHRYAPPAHRWTGTLTVDLPGHSSLPLVGPSVTAQLTHACFQGEGAGTRTNCSSH